jgi:hypothetical protein
MFIRHSVYGIFLQQLRKRQMFVNGADHSPYGVKFRKHVSITKVEKQHFSELFPFNLNPTQRRASFLLPYHLYPPRGCLGATDNSDTQSSSSLLTDLIMKYNFKC